MRRQTDCNTCHICSPPTMQLSRVASPPRMLPSQRDECLTSLAMATTSVCSALPPLFRKWTKHDLILAAEDPDRQSIHPGQGAIHYTRELRLQARIVIHLPDVPLLHDYAVWTSKVPSSWLQGDIVEVYLVAVQPWMVQRPTLTPQAVSMFIQEQGRPPLDCITFFMPM